MKDSEAAGSTVYDYDCAGRKMSVNYPSGAREIYTYLDNNLLDTLKNYSTGGAIPDDSYSYTYDAAGNQLSKSEIVGSVNKGVTQFAYDELNRLSRVTEPNGKQTAYTYDGAGNRLTETVTENEAAKLISYSYNEQNRLTHSESDKNNTKETTVYKYDNNGNLLYKSMEITKKIDPYNPPTTHFGMFIPGQGKTEYAPQEVIDSVGYYSYDAFNRLIKETSGNGTIESKYNGEGLRVQTTSNGVVKRYVYESDKVVLEVDDRGRQTARNVYGSSLISRRMGAQQAYYFYNGHGDVTRLIDSGGIELASYYYDAWGTVLGEDEDEGIDNPYRYAGYVYDKETKLYYLNARYYDPQTARFLSEDTYRGDPNDPLSLNLYTYVSNNPIKYIDPTGHWEQDDEEFSFNTQTKLIALTQAYYDAKTGVERGLIHEEAKKLRAEHCKERSKKNKSALSDKLNEIYETQDYYIESTWDQTLKDSNIVVTKKQNTKNNTMDFNFLAYTIDVKIDFFNVDYKGDKKYYGGNQYWFRDWLGNDIKHQSGCGPVAAANIIAYYMLKGKLNTHISSYGLSGSPIVLGGQFIDLMNLMYDSYVTQSTAPGLGVWYMDDFVSGVEKYMKQQGGIPNTSQINDFSTNGSDAADFILKGLLDNNPVTLLLWKNSFTNTYPGYTQNYSNHFMTITGIHYDVESGKYDVGMSTWGEYQTLRDFGAIWDEKGLGHNAFLAFFNPVSQK